MWIHSADNPLFMHPIHVCALCISLIDLSIGLIHRYTDERFLHRSVTLKSLDRYATLISGYGEKPPIRSDLVLGSPVLGPSMLVSSILVFSMLGPSTLHASLSHARPSDTKTRLRVSESCMRCVAFIEAYKALNNV